MLKTSIKRFHCYNVTTALGAATYYFKWIIGDTSLVYLISMLSVITLPLMFTFPKVIKKIGTIGDMIAAFCVMGIIGYLIVFLAYDNLPAILTGALLAAFSTMPLAYYGVLFIMKCCTYNEMQGLPRMDSSAGVLGNFTTKIGSAVGTALTGVLLGVSGYISGEGVKVQPDSAILIIRILYSLIPAIFLVVIGIAAKAFAPLERRIPEWEDEKKREN